MATPAKFIYFFKNILDWLDCNSYFLWFKVIFLLKWRFPLKKVKNEVDDLGQVFSRTLRIRPETGVLKLAWISSDYVESLFLPQSVENGDSKQWDEIQAKV